jgi:alpha-1,2-mannosyltransferase
MPRLIDILRSGAWLTAERMRLVAIGMLAAGLIGAGFLIITSNGLNDRLGRPLGTDFSNVYAAGTYVLDGEAAKPFDPARQYAREKAIFGEHTDFYGWHYPPFFLGLAALLALMPYGLALAVWQGVTLALYVLAIRGIIDACAPSPRSRGEGRGEGALPQALASGEPPSPGRFAADLSPQAGRGEESVLGGSSFWLLLALAFPAVFVNLGHGQNGFLTAALMAAALVQLDKRPMLAGVLFACLAYKPQFGVLIPLVLSVSGRWRAFSSGAITVLALALVVTLVFGVDVWSAFLSSTKFTRAVVLEQGDTGWHKVQSVFSVVRMWGGGVSLAYALQGATTLLVAGTLALLWRSRAPFPLKAAALAIGTILATPYSLDYDLMLLAPAIAFLAADGLARGFGPYEKTTLALLWIVPLVTRAVAQTTLIPLAVPAMLLCFMLVLHRAMRGTGTSANLWPFAARSLE